MIAGECKTGFAFKQLSLITCNTGVQSAPILPNVVCWLVKREAFLINFFLLRSRSFYEIIKRVECSLNRTNFNA